MKTPEADLKDKVKKFLSSIPEVWFFMPVPMGYGVRGIPDFVGCWKGKFFAIETKAIRGKESPWQKKIREKILEAGGIAFVAWEIEDVHNAFFGET
ncbi:MAG: hypothetical protein KGL39_11630 [Patescibacteria group bacterium]|nr:hypothetical protein [Patescibacteria group bacterium]